MTKETEKHISSFFAGFIIGALIVLILLTATGNTYYQGQIDALIRITEY